MIVEAFDPVNDVETRLGSVCVSELIDTLDLRKRPVSTVLNRF